MKRMSTILASAAALAAANTAGATPFTVTYIGTVSDDYYSNFLSGGQSAAGDAYSETYVIDPATPGATTENSPNYNYTVGSDEANPVLSDTITIAGQSFSAPVPSASYYSEGDDYQTNNQNGFANQASDYQYSYDANGYFDGYNVIYNYYGNPIVPAVYGGSGSYTVQAGDYAYGYVQTYNDNSGLYKYLYLTPSAVIFNAAVPEPATWALMLAGFGLVGAAMRRRTLAPAPRPA